jgi:mannose-6-phosphate isomerase-like protein (cupin superfamily)
MAKIHIASGEHFEHSHSQDSTSRVLSGTVEIMLNDVTIQMSQDEELKVPAFCSHSFRNIGVDEVIIDCSYGP